MKAIVQRVKGATSIRSVASGGAVSNGEFTGAGLVVLLGWTASDSAAADFEKKEEWVFSRIDGLRVFPDADGRMNLNLVDYLRASSESGGILWVPQFTLAAKLESGFRPSFTAAMEPGAARARFERFVERRKTETRAYKEIYGVFGAEMDLTFTNWGPVTIPLEV